MDQLRTLLERFANGMSLGVIGDAMQALYQDAQNDEELRNWFRDCDAYARRVSYNLISVDVGDLLNPSRPRSSSSRAMSLSHSAMMKPTV